MVPLYISELYVQWVTYGLSRSTCTSITGAPDFQIWLLHFGKYYANLRIEIVDWYDWLKKYSPPWAV